MATIRISMRRHRAYREQYSVLWRSGASKSWRIERKELRCRGRSRCCGRQDTFFETAAVKEPWTPNAALTTKGSMRCGSSFVPLGARSGLLRTKETMRVWLLCWSVWRIDRWLKDDNLCSLSLVQWSSKVLVANASSAPVGSSAMHDSDMWIQTKRTLK